MGTTTLARAALEESVSVLRPLNDAWGLALPLRHLGLVALREGDLDHAARYVAESITTLAKPGDPWFGARGLEAMAAIGVARGDFASAARLFGAAEAWRGPAGAAVPPYERGAYDDARERVREGLGAAAVSAAWAEGRAMRPEDAFRYALSKVTERRGSVLSPREQQVLHLLSRGLSNRGIAEDLGITTKTTESHVSNILRKLNLSSRAQAAVWAVQNHSGQPRPGGSHAVFRGNRDDDNRRTGRCRHDQWRGSNRRRSA